MRVFLTIVFGLIGVILLAGGIYLITLGGSPFIGFSGAALLVTTGAVAGGWPAAVGAFALTAVLLLATGLWPALAPCP